MPFHFTRLDQLSAPYRHIYLSPHLDDAALSCGGSIAQHTSSNTPVLIVNVCSGAPAAETRYSPFAHLQHTRWGFPAAEAIARRLREDAEALETLRADSFQLDLLDAIYRLPESYHDDATLFGTLAADDPLIGQVQTHLVALAARFPEAVFYAPLGVGQHVDHQAVFHAAQTLSGAGVSVAFYEDFPYVIRTGALEQRLDELGRHAQFMPVVTTIDTTLARKIGAVEAYVSQLDILFGGAAAMAYAVRTYAAAVHPDTGAHGERIWLQQ